MPHGLTSEQRDELQALRDEGLTIEAIADQTGWAYNTCARHTHAPKV